MLFDSVNIKCSRSAYICLPGYFALRLLSSAGMNNLSKNIRFLRKQRKLSQQQLADELEVKRSNIAAYETKNVEPRLSLIHRMARFFGVALTDLVVSDLAAHRGAGADRIAATGISGKLGTDGPSTSFNLTVDQQKLLGYSDKIAKMLEGFRVFYEYKRGAGMTESGQHATDLANFLVFIDHMLTYNQQVMAILGGGSLPQVSSGQRDQQPGGDAAFQRLTDFAYQGVRGESNQVGSPTRRAPVVGQDATTAPSPADDYEHQADR